MLTKIDKITWIKIHKRLNKGEVKGLFYTVPIQRRRNIKFPNPVGKAKSIVTLPGITGVNEGPVVDIFTEIYIADVKLIEGAYVRINRSTPTVS